MGNEAKMLAQISMGKVIFVAILMVLAWLALKWMTGFFDGLERRNPRLRFLARQVEPPLRILIWFGALMLAVDILAPSKDAFLAALGSAALAIGLGMQDLIKNLIGGLVIVADRPYQIGDMVQLGGTAGEVTHIGLRSTKVMTSAGVLVTVPNVEVLNGMTFNANGGVPECMVSTDVSVPHGADPDLVLRVGREVAVACPYTHIGRKIEVDLDDRGVSSHFAKVSIAAYVYDHRYQSAMRTDILRRAKREFVACGILHTGERPRGAEA
jgi:small-conductance mechanosensitive channel